MMYTLKPTQHDNRLFFRLDGEAADRHGAIGHLRADFGKSGQEFWKAWFDSQAHLKTSAFGIKFDELMDTLRNEGPCPPFASRDNLIAFTRNTPGKELAGRGGGYEIRTHDYSCFFRCRPSKEDYDIYCFAFDNRYLLSELAGEHELPDSCYSVLPNGALVTLFRNSHGFRAGFGSQLNWAENRRHADRRNKENHVTKAQEAAMLAGCLDRWDIPAAKPWNYDQYGNPRFQLKRRLEPER